MAKSKSTLGYVLVMGLAFGGAACYASRAPLGPASDGIVEPALLGAWLCRGDAEGTDRGDELRLEFFQFDGTQYYVSWQEAAGRLDHLRAFSALVEDQPFLNVQWLENGWNPEEAGFDFVAYSLAADGGLELRAVRPELFEHADTSPEEARAALEYALHEAETFSEPLRCRRSDARDRLTP